VQAHRRRREAVSSERFAPEEDVEMSDSRNDLGDEGE
jgi:hypothetical protein